MAAVLRLHKEVLQIDAAAAQEGREIPEKQRKADLFPICHCENYLRAVLFKQPLVQQLLRRHDLVQHVLIVRELADEIQNERLVPGDGPPYLYIFHTFLRCSE